ncbi:MAG: dTDP-glucose 4,6-dehydratase [Thermodesulfovibrionales bacterium]|nr:dTDP-glucose 4,6-dehydratase [Thermodesulfovibrionales bacterium]
MKILVTGGAGFIGSEFVRQGVRKGYAITVLDKLSYAGDKERLREVDRDIMFSEADIGDRRSVEEIFRQTRPDAVVHWAAESHVDRSIQDASPFIEANVRGTQVLLDVCRISQVEKFINVSTDEVYGDLGEEGQFLESTPLNPSSPYSVSKASADMLGRAYHRTYGIPVITVRPSNNYGPWQYPEKLIPVVVMKAVNNERVPVYARGENVREWLHVSDCASAVFGVLEKGQAGEVYNIGSGQEKKNIEVVKTILRILGKQEGLIEFVEDRPGHDFRYSLNSNRIRTELGWATRVPFEQGIEHTVGWYLENMEWTRSKLKSR